MSHNPPFSLSPLFPGVIVHHPDPTNLDVVQHVAHVLAPADLPRAEAKAEQLATAKFIIRACNAHADLLAALEVLLACVPKRTYVSFDGPVENALQPAEIVKARAAIAKAKGESS